MSNTDNSQSVPNRNVLALVGWWVLCFTAASTGIFVTIDGWFTRLNTPSWNPPAWVFGPVWTVLYLMMGVAAWLVWSQGGWKAQRLPLGLFLIQLVLNAAWTPLFFGMHRIGLALIDIAMLWLSLSATVIAFWQVNRPAGWLLVPYLAWVSFAAVLNFTLWRMNPQ